MNVTYINPFLSATADLFAKMINVPLKLGKPLLRTPEDRLYKLYRISAIVEMQGKVSGRVVLSFSNPVAFALCGALAGRKFDVVDGELADALGEIANMVVGGARTKLPNAAEIRMAPPEVRPTQDVTYPPNVPVIMIPFDTAAGRFIIEMAMRVSAPAVAEPKAAPVGVPDGPTTPVPTPSPTPAVSDAAPAPTPIPAAAPSAVPVREAA